MSVAVEVLRVLRDLVWFGISRRRLVLLLAVGAVVLVSLLATAATTVGPVVLYPLM